MKLQKITLCNWQGYFGEKEFSFNGTGEKSSSIIYAENTFGKSAFWEAIHFALYGKVEIRRRKKTYRPVIAKNSILAPMMNTDLFGTSGAHFYVELLFTHRESEYKLYRGYKPRYDTTPVKKPNDLVMDISLENLSKRGSDRHIANEDRWIEENLLPKRLAKFFLFDGERLEEYEDLMTKDQDIILRKDIRDIIRTPILYEGNIFLKKAESKFGVDEAKEKMAKKDNEDLRIQYESLLKELTKAEEAKKKLIEEKDKYQEEIDSCEEWLRQEDKTAEAAIRLDSLKGDIRNATEAISGFEDDIILALKDTWKILIKPAVDDALSKIVSERKKQHKLTGEIAIIDKDIENLNNEIKGNPCDSCKRPREEPSEERKNEIDDEISNLNKDRKKKEKNAKYPTNEEFYEKKSALEKLSSDSNLEVLVMKEKKLMKEKIKLFNAKKDRKEQMKFISEEQNEQVKEVMKNKKSLDEKVRQCDIDLEFVKATIEEANKNLSSFTNIKNPKDKDLTKKMKKIIASRRISYELAEIFKQGLEEFTETMRSNVEKRASETFLTISNNRSNYNGLNITKDYNVSIINKKGMEDIGSQGQSMVMAYAIIEALSSCSGFEFPMIIDTPGRSLSRSNMKHVFDFMIKSKRQVIFLPNDLELDPDEGDKRYGKFVASTYQLGKDEYDRTLIVEREVENLRD